MEKMEKYYLVTHKTSGKQFRATAPSARNLRRHLPRYCNIAAEYTSMWTIQEITQLEYFKQRDLETAPNGKAYG